MSLPDLSPLEAARPLRRWVAPRLLNWFAHHQRPLPWRRDRDPYRIWVSEVMLQQTQASVVAPYFERFLKTFPTLADLARSDEQDVLRLWEGLGYYRRARDLHASARRLLADHEGQLPNDPDLLDQLPGFGRYTRNAVLSQAFDRSLPILEANSQRVLSRLFGRREDPRQGPARRWLWQAAEAILPAKQCGEFNQALMELGALICTPSRPRCGDCPLSRRCLAHKLGEQESIPARAASPEIIPVREAGLVVRRGDRILLVQRPATGRWANLWEFPHGTLQDEETYDAAALRLLSELTGLEGRLGTELQTLQHGITRFRITLICFEVEYSAGVFRSAFYQQGKWLRPAELARYPVSAPQRRLARSLAKPGRQQRLF